MPRSRDQALRALLGPADGPWRSRPGLRDAAVLAPLFSRDGEDRLLLTLRRRDLPDHAGQVAFPGGAREGDEGPVACALRETREEVGLAASVSDVLGRLPDRVSIAGYLVAAFVARVEPPSDLRPDPREVERVLEIPLAAIADPALWLRAGPGRTDGVVAGAEVLDVSGAPLWGLTARLARDLAAAWAGSLVRGGGDRC